MLLYALNYLVIYLSKGNFITFPWHNYTITRTCKSTIIEKLSLCKVFFWNLGRVTRIASQRIKKDNKKEDLHPPLIKGFIYIKQIRQLYCSLFSIFFQYCSIYLNNSLQFNFKKQKGLAFLL